MVNQLSKVRRGDDKKKVAAAIASMSDDEQAALNELIQMDVDLFGDNDESHWLDWDDFDPEDDYFVEEDYIEDSDYDPWMEMDYDYFR